MKIKEGQHNYVILSIRINYRLFESSRFENRTSVEVRFCALKATLTTAQR
jgi:hypothetical protein